MDKKYNTPMEREFRITKSDLNEMTESQRIYGEKFPYQNKTGFIVSSGIFGLKMCLDELQGVSSSSASVDIPQMHTTDWDRIFGQ